MKCSVCYRVFCCAEHRIIHEKQKHPVEASRRKSVTRPIPVWATTSTGRLFQTVAFATACKNGDMVNSIKKTRFKVNNDTYYYSDDASEQQHRLKGKISVKPDVDVEEYKRVISLPKVAADIDDDCKDTEEQFKTEVESDEPVETQHEGCSPSEDNQFDEDEQTFYSAYGDHQSLILYHNYECNDQTDSHWKTGTPLCLLPLDDDSPKLHDDKELSSPSKDEDKTRLYCRIKRVVSSTFSYLYGPIPAALKAARIGLQGKKRRRSQEPDYDSVFISDSPSPLPKRHCAHK